MSVEIGDFQDYPVPLSTFTAKRYNQQNSLYLCLLI